MKKEIETRLIRHLTFLEKELGDWGNFKSLTVEQYQWDRDRGRNVERWIENIINSSIDISKIILLSEDVLLPDTYREIVASLSALPEFDQENILRISEMVRFRNIISHQYIDIRWNSIKKFIADSGPIFKNFLKEANDYLKKRLE